MASTAIVRRTVPGRLTKVGAGGSIQASRIILSKFQSHAVRCLLHADEPTLLPKYIDRRISL